MPIVHVLTTSDLMRPIRIPTSAGRGAERPTMGSCIRCPIRRLCCRPSLQEPPRWSPGPQMEAKQNTLAQAGVRRNRLKNNTTRLSSAPDQAICNCWHKRTLAGYLRQCAHGAVIGKRKSASATEVIWMRSGNSSAHTSSPRNEGSIRCMAIKEIGLNRCAVFV
jgi:hypothetical protein